MIAERLQLRDYQEAAVTNVIAALGSRPILVAPCGAGKTVMATDMVERLNLPTLWLAHRKELIDQAAGRIESHGLSTGIIKAGYPTCPLAQVQVASVQTLVRRDKPRAGLIVVDEAHHATADTYQKILDAYDGIPVVGLTATPFRLDGRGLGDLFGEIVVAAWTDDLCKAGVLHEPKVWAAKAPDLRGVRVTAGDYNLGQLSERSNTRELQADIIETWQKRAAGRRTVAFAVDVAHSHAITEAFCAAGVPAEHLDGTTPDDERDAILARLRSGETQIVSNCMVLTEGWDLPALECAIIARPTASLNLHLQMIGRVMRACDGKGGAVVLDHAGNHLVHGLVTRRLHYALGNEKVGFSEPLGLRRCKQCGLLFETELTACPECGWTEPIVQKGQSEFGVHNEGELAEFEDDFEYRRQAWNLIEADREASGYKPGWSFHRFEDLFGVKPAVLNGELIDACRATMDEKRAMFEQFTRIAAERGYKRGWAAYRYKDTFGCWPRGFVADVRAEQAQQRYAEAQA